MKWNLKNRILDIVALIGLLGIAFTQQVYSQQATSTQVVMLRVLELNKIDLVGGPLTLQVNSIDDNAAQPNSAIDASTKLLWTSNGDAQKIAVGSNVASPRFILKIEAQKSGSGSGTAEPEVTLSDNSPHNLILGVQRSAGSCELKFTAIADVERGIGSESHLITYTITGG
jgi:hypothetical protein